MNLSFKSFKLLRLIGLFVLVAAFAAGCTGIEPEDTEPTYPDFGIMEETMPETCPPVQVEMPDFELTYSGAFQDLIQVQKLEKEGTLVFSVKLSRSEEEIFTMVYGTDEGDLVTALEDSQGNRIWVAFRMNAVPENLSEEDEQLFCSAQETVNEIVESLVLK